MVLALEATQFQAEKGMKYADLDKPLHFYGYCLLSYVSKETGNVVVNEEAVTGRKGWVDYLKEALGWNGQDTSIGEGKYVDKAVNFWVREQTKPNGKGGYEISVNEKTGTPYLELGAIYKAGGLKETLPEILKSFGSGWRTVAAPKPAAKADEVKEDDIPF